MDPGILGHTAKLNNVKILIINNNCQIDSLILSFIARINYLIIVYLNVF